MSLSDSCRSIRLEGSILKAECKQPYKGWAERELDLNAVLGDSEEKFVWNQSGYAAGAYDIRLRGTMLWGRWAKRNGELHADAFDLNHHIANIDGRLVAL